MIKKVDVLMTHSSQYGVLFHFTRKLYDAFVRSGVKTRLLEGDDMFSIPARDPPDMTVGFNGAPRTPEKVMYCDKLRVPHLSLLVDPPYRFFYLVSSPYTIIGCDDRVCCHLLDALDFTRNIFLPHAVEPELAQDKPRDRLFDLVMLATFIDYERRRDLWKTKFPGIICKLMNEAAEITFSDPKLSFITAFHTAISEDQRTHPTTPYEPANITEVLQELELYIKGRDRALLAKSIQDVPLHIFGGTADIRDWKEFLGKKHPNIFTHGPVEFAQALEIMKQSKILLNPSLKNKEGAHERIFSGLACGALVVTNQSQYLDETFREGEGLVYYQHGKLDALNQTISDCLSDEKRWMTSVAKGRHIVLQSHTWDQRVAKILQELPPFLAEMRSQNSESKIQK